jgi:hypothetical protein
MTKQSNFSFFFDGHKAMRTTRRSQDLNLAETVSKYCVWIQNTNVHPHVLNARADKFRNEMI